MIKKILYCITLTLLTLLLGACGAEDMNLSGNIAAPDNKILPITGKWIIEDYKLGNTSDMDENIAENYIGEEVLFHKELVAVGDDVCWEPAFKAKIVNPMDYLIYQYRTTPEYLQIEQDKIQVVSVESRDQIFNEYIKISEDNIIMDIKGSFFMLKKLTDNIEPELIAKYYDNVTTQPKFSGVEKNGESSSGILVGLKSLDLRDGESALENWQYRTIFIRRDAKGLASIYEMDELFVPRKKGFAKVAVNRLQKKENVEDKITISSINQSSDRDTELQVMENDQDKDKQKEEVTLKNILYIGNDYISIEKVHYLNKGEKALELHLIDHLDKNKALKISDISGEIGKNAFMEGADKAIKTEYIGQKTSSMDLRPREESFGLFRRNGHWIFRGRLDIVEENKYSYKDFNIKATPPKALVQYDELPISWNKIKMRIPEAVDAFISPNEDMLIVLTHNAMLVYLLDDGNIDYTPEAKLELNSTERVVMSEWALDKYSQIWEEEFLNNDVHSLK